MTATIRDLMMSGETLVFGHRGAMAYAPMNTLASFQLAQQQGAHGIELDVQLSADGIPVIIHDHSVDATTDGAGMVSDKTLTALKDLDAGAWFAPKFVGERIPTLDEVIERFAGDLLINIEIKSARDQSNGIEAAVSRCIRHHQVLNRVIVSSFNPLVLQRVRKSFPEVMIGALTGPSPPPGIQESFGPSRHEARHPWHEAVDADYMRWARDHRFFVIAWTVNAPERALQLRALGVNAIITDNPDRIVAAFSA